VPGGQPIGEPAGAVGRVVIDDQHMRPGDGVPQFADERFDVFALVVGWRDDDNAHSGRAWKPGEDTII